MNVAAILDWLSDEWQMSFQIPVFDFTAMRSPTVEEAKEALEAQFREVDFDSFLRDPCCCPQLGLVNCIRSRSEHNGC